MNSILRTYMPIGAARHRRRQCVCACLLLFVFCLQRILGIIGGDLVYTIEQTAEMNAGEHVIAEKVKKETGSSAHIEIRDEKQLELLQSLGYSSPFIFSEEIDGQEVYYTVGGTPVTTIAVTFPEAHATDPAPLPGSTKALYGLLLSKFFFWEQHLSFSTTIADKLPGSTVPLLLQQAVIAVPSPPPKAWGSRQ